MRDNQPVGITGHYTIIGQEQDIWLGWMGILPAYLGQKLGPVLVEAAFEKALHTGVNNLRIWTTQESAYDAARNMYRKMGFIEEPYNPAARDAGSLVSIFSRQAQPQGSPAQSWARAGYAIDCEAYVIPSLNRKLEAERVAEDVAYTPRRPLSSIPSMA